MFYRISTSVLLLIVCFSFKLRPAESDMKHLSSVPTEGRYKVGDVVKCTQWENGSYWKGKVTKILKDVIYQVELSDIRVEGALKLYLSPSECTGKKRLSYENGKGYYETNIWVHDRCLD